MFEQETACDVTYDPDAQSKFALLNEMYVEPGTKEDWDALHHLHYKSEGKPFGPNYYRLVLHGETIGVVVLTMPKGLLKERHAVFDKIKPGADSKTANTIRYRMINANTRVVGRIVLDTMYRGVGASYRFQNIVSRMSGKRVIEIQSAMSKYNLFAHKAGFKFAKPMRSTKFKTGVKFFRETFEAHPADTRAILAELESLPTFLRDARIKEVRRFYYANSAQEKTGANRGDVGKIRVENMPVDELIENLQQLVLGSPLYGVYLNPDYQRDDIPDRLPLTAFDNQATDEELKL